MWIIHQQVCLSAWEIRSDAGERNLDVHANARQHAAVPLGFTFLRLCTSHLHLLTLLCCCSDSRVREDKQKSGMQMNAGGKKNKKKKTVEADSWLGFNVKKAWFFLKSSPFQAQSLYLYINSSSDKFKRSFVFLFLYLPSLIPNTCDWI